MKNYKQILEAVNRGIQLALDDFDDEDQVQNVKSKQINHRDYTKEYLDLVKDEVVDLGLPSGTLWCKYNLDVDPTKLSKVEDWYGRYYAWGELEGNKTNEKGEIYFEYNYKFGNDYDKLTKYCNDPEYGLKGFTDNLIQLLPEDDAAYQNKKFLNFKFHIPTKEQCEELLKYTKNYWIRNYDPNKTIHNPKGDGGIIDLNGRVFVGKNGNQLFIPAAGCYVGSSIYYVGSECNLWISSIKLDSPYDAYYFCLDNNSEETIISGYRGYGFNIRPVINL